MKSPARRNTGAKSADKRRSVQLQTYKVIARAVEEGTQYGIRRYVKYAGVVDTTANSFQEHELTEHIEREVLNALCEVIRFDDEERG